MESLTKSESHSHLYRGKVLDGAVLRRLPEHRDARGSFTEVFCDFWQLPIGPTQWSVVRSEARVLRGMHLHWDHDEYVCVVQGTMLVGLHDLRPDSPTYRASALYELCGDDPACLAFPAGIIHGWYAREGSLHLQAVSECYRDYHPHDNLTCHFADPDLDLPWPDPHPIVSERAAAAGPLADLIPRV